MSPTVPVPENEPRNPGFGRRHILCAVLCFGYFATYLCRSNISIAVTAMTSVNSSNPNFPIYDWDNTAQNAVISSFYAGLVVSSVVAGEVIRIFGAQKIMYISFIGQALMTVITELCASGGWVLLAVNRSLIGLSSGFVDPLFFYASSKCLPINERNTQLNFIFSGAGIGTAMATQVGGLLAQGPTGWPSIFYFSTVFLVIFCILWKLFGFWSPDQCRSIRREELIYIENSLASVRTQTDSKVPWKSISTSVPVYAIFVAEIAQGAILAVLVTQLVLFVNSVDKVSVSMNGLLTSIPIYFQILWQNITGKVSDVLLEKKIVTTDKVRKIASTLAMSGNGVMILLIGLTGNSLVATIVLMFFCFFCLSCSYTGYLTNPLDLSQNYSQNIVGISRAVENASSFLTPLVFSALLADSTSLESWRLPFTVTAVLCILCNVVYVIFGKAERQSWDVVESEKSTSDP